MPFTVHVSEAHIADNDPYSTTKCAIARAVREQFPGKWVTIGTWTAHIGDKTYFMSNNVLEFLDRNRDHHKEGTPAPNPIDVVFTEIDGSEALDS